MINFIYITTNNINGKQYVGSHNGNKNKYFGSGLLIKKAIKKYGIINFNRKILKECNSIREARLLEKFYISKYNTIQPAGYNISPTGGLTLYGCHSNLTKLKIGNSLRGKKRTAEQKKLMSEKAKLRKKPNNFKVFSEKEKLTIIYLHRMFNKSSGFISNKLNIQRGRIERFLKKKKIYTSHKNHYI